MESGFLERPASLSTRMVSLTAPVDIGVEEDERDIALAGRGRGGAPLGSVIMRATPSTRPVIAARCPSEVLAADARGDEEVVTAAAGFIVDAAEEGGVELAVEVGDADAEDAAAACHEALGEAVGAEVELVDGLADALGGFGGDEGTRGC